MLGFELEKRFWIEATRSHTAMLRKGPLRFELFEADGVAPLPEGGRHPPRDIRTHGNKHLAFQLENLESFLIEMETKGADIAIVVREDFGKGCFIRDCAGNLIEFVEEPNP